MREIKFRAWDGSSMVNSQLFGVTMNGKLEFNGGSTGIVQLNYPIMQFTGLHDKNGKEIYEGDLLNVFFTSGNGEHVHDCIYEAKIHSLNGLTLDFKRLHWESYGHNQYPISTTLSVRYDNLDCDYREQNYESLAVKDTYEENHLLRDRWKGLDYSNYIEVIGNIYENPELLEGDKND